MPKTPNTMPVAQQIERLKAIEAVNERRSLTEVEISEYERLINLKRIRKHRIPKQIETARLRLQKLHNLAQSEGIIL